MTIEFTAWPNEFAEIYRQKGYWTDRPLTDLIDHAPKESVAILCGERQFTYADLCQKSQNLAGYLHRLGLKKGDTALVQLPNVAEFYVVFFALIRLGIVPVNALFSHNENELSAYVKQIQPSIVIASQQHKLFENDQYWLKLQQQDPSLKHILLAEGSWGASLVEAMAISSPNLVEHPNAADQVAFFQLSGGSTGTPKLIPRTHNDYFFSIRRSVEICEFSSSTVYLCALPCAHNFPMSSPGAFGVFHAGGCLVMAPNPEANVCFDLIERHQVKVVALVPPALALWMQVAVDRKPSLASLSLVQVGGAKLSESIARQVPEKLGCQLQQILGMAEGLVNYTRLDDDFESIVKTQGYPMCSMDEVKVIGVNGQQVAPGEEGELVTRGPYTIRGYYKAPEHNAKVFDSEGFYHTGDLVSQNEKGYLTVVGRDKDQINRGGEKIAAEEIENLLLKHEHILHSALVAMPDQVMGEKICAFVVPRYNSSKLKSVQLRKYLRGFGIADYKVPDRFEFIDALPITPVGKPNKVVLREVIRQRLQLNNVS
ncbi:(2,3-dihydroxybenzoyl)adenylate synthase [Marinomonas posidonica]|uniref:Long-chain-fatty-acid--CoA ligase n=1 Tax=Marinomonas posidonica (strain CECT 7376 / NCIMB 14433 / IVIA-Po-181) TaxID=491952 RepID=F6CU83_MARPP|nr:(2,3-dihydroxybenzoyl)adenylate synthase [Marinomonas posidonica]AEF55202.1 2,3-dihydroxybenzoate-AMP ligase [Marinomonas posidonica IVIA-Po-181]